LNSSTGFFALNVDPDLRGLRESVALIGG